MWFFSLDAARLGAAANIEIGRRYEPAELTELDHFLIARWALFSAPRVGLRHARAFHDPWPLHRANIIEPDDTLVTPAGLRAPQGPPLVHYALSVTVRIRWPTKIADR